MGVKNTEFLEDRLVVHYELEKPHQNEDEVGKLEIMFNEISKLPRLHPASRLGFGSFGYDAEIIAKIPNTNKKIGLVFEMYPELEGPNTENMYGPYLIY